jgi:putative endonuclease
MIGARRRRAQRRGQRAELLCLWHLRLRGYRLVARRYRVPSGEIDLIVRRGRVLAAVEVKARDDDAAAGAAVLARQRRRIARALEHFLASRPDLAGLDPRFDVMLVVPRRLPRHLADAWRIDG